MKCTFPSGNLIFFLFLLFSCFTIFIEIVVFLFFVFSLTCKRSVNIEMLQFGQQICHLTFNSLFSWAPKSLQLVTVAMKLKDTCSLEEKL